ncbi:IPT/TIG domain-containing protein [Reichenbachiella sp.]|uniref:IPT/TIG domain-containing protein n=1 Tax=Reichenbachiella sp. TaxID=2184521 RepID=UPI00329909CD
MKKIILSLIGASILLSCSKDEEPILVLEVTTEVATDITPVSAELSGTITQLGSSPITDHGFFISEFSDLANATKLTLGQKSAIGGFSIIVEELIAGTTYHYQSYASDSEAEHLGNVITFESTTPQISGVAPEQGSAGEEVIISGAGFVEGMKIRIGIGEAEIIALDNTSAKVLVPKGLGIEPVNLVVVLGSTEYPSDVEFLPIYSKWERVTDFPGVSRNNAISFAIGSVGYVGFGANVLNGDVQSFNDFWKYDQSSDSWTQLRDKIEPGFGASFAIDGVGYAGVGFTSNEFWQYDAQDDLWLRVADFPGTDTGEVYWFVIDGKAYVGRGEVGEEDREFWMYDPLNDMWILKTTFPGKWAQQAFSLSANGKGYLGLGSGRKDIWEYTLETNSWKQLNDFPAENQTNRFPTAFYINNEIFLGITYGGAGIEWDTNFWRYNEVDDSWDKLSNFPFRPARFSAGTVMVINGNGYMGLGLDIGLNFYKFTPPGD